MLDTNKVEREKQWFMNDNDVCPDHGTVRDPRIIPFELFTIVDQLWGGFLGFQVYELHSRDQDFPGKLYVGLATKQSIENALGTGRIDVMLSVTLSPRNRLIRINTPLTGTACDHYHRSSPNTIT
jgi:hypothetical protein